jgi:hypothetical protein
VRGRRREVEENLLIGPSPHVLFSRAISSVGTDQPGAEVKQGRKQPEELTTRVSNSLLERDRRSNGHEDGQDRESRGKLHIVELVEEPKAVSSTVVLKWGILMTLYTLTDINGTELVGEIGRELSERTWTLNIIPREWIGGAHLTTAVMQMIILMETDGLLR